MISWQHEALEPTGWPGEQRPSGGAQMNCRARETHRTYSSTLLVWVGAPHDGVAVEFQSYVHYVNKGAGMVIGAGCS